MSARAARTATPSAGPLDSFVVRRPLAWPGGSGATMSLAALAQRFPSLRRLPFAHRLLLENLLRHENGTTVLADQIAALATRAEHPSTALEVAFHPTRVLLQDYSGLVAIVDLASLREEIAEAGGDPAEVQPLRPVDLVIDHSLIVNAVGADALARNLADEYAQNGERYRFLKWAQQAFANLRVVPPGNGIVHQVNLEQLASPVALDDQTGLVHPETQVGADSHTTMVNGLGVLAWGVGGIEAEAAMLGEPLALLVPPVTGVRLSGQLRPGVLATDAVLRITERLRAAGVVDHFVEFFGPALPGLSVADRATFANMAPEYGATCGLFPIDERTLDYLALTGRPQHSRAFAAAWAALDRSVAGEVAYDAVVEVDLGAIGRTVAGPQRPQQAAALAEVLAGLPEPVPHPGEDLRDGDIVLAAITSCTNTSNPRAMLAAGLLARNAVAAGLQVPAHVKASLSPGSRAVADYLEAAALLAPLARLGFHLVGFGCATCVGNGGPLHPEVDQAVRRSGATVAAVLSGNRNFEGRIHPLVKLNYLASPPLVVGYALAGNLHLDLETAPLGRRGDGRAIRLQDLWPSEEELDRLQEEILRPSLYGSTGARADALWDALDAPHSSRFPWKPSGYIGRSPFFAGAAFPRRIADARPLLLLGDNVTTDHISPVGSIAAGSPAAALLSEAGIAPADFNTYGARRGNAEVMLRGTFASPRLRNMLAGRDGGCTRVAPSGELMPIPAAAAHYRAAGEATVIVAGAAYGTGSARDWAAKGTRMLGVAAVIAESFERIHRANLVLLRVLPIELASDVRRDDLGITLESTLCISLPDNLVRAPVTLEVRDRRGAVKRFPARLRIDTAQEAASFAAGGLLPAIRDRFLAKAKGAAA